MQIPCKSLWVKVSAKYVNVEEPYGVIFLAKQSLSAILLGGFTTYSEQKEPQGTKIKSLPLTVL